MSPSIPPLRLMLLGTISIGFSIAQAADNDAVLRQWASSSGQAAPTIVQDADGNTRLSWTHTTTLDSYRASGRGGDMLTPVGDGNFARLQWQSDLRRAQGEESLDWLIFGLDISNDRSVVRNDWNLSNLQLGRSTQNWRMAAGDVPIDHSSLGARGDMRGLFAERSLGRVQLSGAAGLQAESWQALADESRRLIPVREAYALKLAGEVGSRTTVYATTQGYKDQQDMGPIAQPGLPLQQGRATTVGLDFTLDRWKLGIEGGQSTWEVENEAAIGDQAFIVDGSWQGERATARIGHHDIGLYYAALSGDVVPGVRETYADGNWRALDTLSLAAGIRQARNAPLGGFTLLDQGAQLRDSRSANASATLNVKAVEGLQVQLNHAGMRGENFNAGAVRSTSNGLTLRYPVKRFSSSLGWQRAKLSNAAMPLQDATATTWSSSLGWSNANAEGVAWQLSFNSQFSWQHQRFTSGTTGINRALSLSMDLNNERWGYLRLSGQVGRLRNTSSGNVLGRSVQLDAGTRLGKAGEMKAYIRNGRTSSTGVNAAYTERIYGLQWLLAVE